MTEEERRKYIKEVYELCGIDSVLVINQKVELERIYCPFVVVAIRDIGDLRKGLKYVVIAVKLSPELIDVYIVKFKAYYHFNFRLIGRIEPNTFV